MRKVVIYSILLFAGLGLSQVLPALLGDLHDAVAVAVRVLTMTGLAFIMVHVGFEFHLDKSQLGRYGWDYVVAFTAASFPWIFVTGYFVFVMLPAEVWSNFDAWKETLLAGRFAAPTSAGVLFSMLAAAGLGATWLFRKARILAIFDDLDTVLLMIPLKMLMVGLAWQLGLVIVVMAALLGIAYVWFRELGVGAGLLGGHRRRERIALRRKQGRRSIGADPHRGVAAGVRGRLPGPAARRGRQRRRGVGGEGAARRAGAPGGAARGHDRLGSLHGHGRSEHAGDPGRR